MAGKPFLHIEIDEHSADAGAITRCEAFLDSITQQTRKRTRRRRDAADRSSTASPRLRAKVSGLFR